VNRNQINRSLSHFDYLEQVLMHALSYCQAVKTRVEGMDEEQIHWVNENVLTILVDARKAVVDFTITDDEIHHESEYTEENTKENW
jgi:ABC-type phosphate transport system auxiliary subunit